MQCLQYIGTGTGTGNIYIGTGRQTAQEDPTQQRQDEHFSVFAQSFGKLVTETRDHGLKASECAGNSKHSSSR